MSIDFEERKGWTSLNDHQPGLAEQRLVQNRGLRKLEPLKTGMPRAEFLAYLRGTEAPPLDTPTRCQDCGGALVEGECQNSIAGERVSCFEFRTQLNAQMEQEFRKYAQQLREGKLEPGSFYATVNIVKERDPNAPLKFVSEPILRGCARCGRPLGPTEACGCYSKELYADG